MPFRILWSKLIKSAYWGSGAKFRTSQGSISGSCSSPGGRSREESQGSGSYNRWFGASDALPRQGAVKISRKRGSQVSMRFSGGICSAWWTCSWLVVCVLAESMRIKDVVPPSIVSRIRVYDQEGTSRRSFIELLVCSIQNLGNISTETMCGLTTPAAPSGRFRIDKRRSILVSLPWSNPDALIV